MFFSELFLSQTYSEQRYQRIFVLMLLNLFLGTEERLHFLRVVKNRSFYLFY
jgi:hypothetical protein